jgi:hypothetical protein
VSDPIVEAFKTVTKLANDSDEQLFQLILKVAEHLKESVIRTVEHACSQSERIDVLEQRITQLEGMLASILDVNDITKH